MKVFLSNYKTKLFCSTFFIFQISELQFLSKKYIKMSVKEHKKREWEPYVDNKGTCAAVAGANYVIAAADTRVSTGYSAQSRESPKIFEITERCALAMSGMRADMVELAKQLRRGAVEYRHAHGRSMTTEAVAQALSNTLYQRRFFPYYAFCVLTGVLSDGSAACYEYDAVGSYERRFLASTGSASYLVQPFLDGQVLRFHEEGRARTGNDVSVEEAKMLIIEAMNSAAERDIHTGDNIDVWTITADGIQKERFPLRGD